MPQRQDKNCASENVVAARQEPEEKDVGTFSESWIAKEQSLDICKKEGLFDGRQIWHDIKQGNRSVQVSDSPYADKPVRLYKNGDMYYGGWKDGQPHGFGVMLNNGPPQKEGLVYVGDFEDGKCQGSGVAVWLDCSPVWKGGPYPQYVSLLKFQGSRVPYNYEGKYKYDKKHDPKAKVTFKNGSTCIGGWKDGKRVGQLRELVAVQPGATARVVPLGGIPPMITDSGQWPESVAYTAPTLMETALLEHQRPRRQGRSSSRSRERGARSVFETVNDSTIYFEDTVLSASTLALMDYRWTKDRNKRTIPARMNHTPNSSERLSSSSPSSEQYGTVAAASATQPASPGVADGGGEARKRRAEKSALKDPSEKRACKKSRASALRTTTCATTNTSCGGGNGSLLVNDAEKKRQVADIVGEANIAAIRPVNIESVGPEESLDYQRESMVAKRASSFTSHFRFIRSSCKPGSEIMYSCDIYMPSQTKTVQVLLEEVKAMDAIDGSRVFYVNRNLQQDLDDQLKSLWYHVHKPGGAVAKFSKSRFGGSTSMSVGDLCCLAPGTDPVVIELVYEQIRKRAASDDESDD